MTKTTKIRWAVAGAASALLLVAMNAGATKKALQVAVTVISGNCTNPTGKQLVVLAEGLNGTVQVCMAEAGVGATATGNCDHPNLGSPTNIRARGGILDTTTFQFSATTGGQGGSPSWGNNVSSLTPVFGPIAGCTMQGQATAHN